MVQRDVWTLGQIAQRLGGRVVGDGSAEIDHLAPLGPAAEGALSFLANPKYRNQLKQTQATAVLIQADVLADCPTNAIVIENPYLAYARASRWFDHEPLRSPGVHSSAYVDPSAAVGCGVYIGPHVTVSANTSIGDNVVLESGVTVGDNAHVGARSYVHANVTIYHGVSVGSDCNIHSGVVLGADGFGFASDQGRWVKIAQLGGVLVGDNVEIGANTTVDRGALEDTVIGDGVILDNQIQIAHNVVIGEYTAIAGCVGIAGSTRVGARCTIGGGAGVAGHLIICDDVHITMMTQVSKSITCKGVYSSGTPQLPTGEWKRMIACLKKLDDFIKRLRRIERVVSNDKH